MKSNLRRIWSPRWIPALAGLLLSLSGCQTLEQIAGEKPSGPEWAAYYGVGGQETTWYTVKTRAELADIVLIGEQHDNVLAHALELKLVEAILADKPNAAVAMEMFERDEQALLDSYTQGQIESATLFEATGSESWGGSEENWRAWYLPVVDSAKANSLEGARVIAANAPRRYAVMAREEGFEALQALADEMEIELFVLPDDAVDENDYRRRFYELMSGHGQGHGDGEPIDPATYFRAQQLWDATLADSVLGATEEHAKVVLLVGDFHIAHDGGLLQRIRHSNPGLEVLTISIQRKLHTGNFDPADIDRADFVIYTRQGAKTLTVDTLKTPAPAEIVLTAHAHAHTTLPGLGLSLEAAPVRRTYGPRSK